MRRAGRGGELVGIEPVSCLLECISAGKLILGVELLGCT